MDFHQLGIFIEVVRQKSFSRAAERVFLTQPTVSSHIKALEEEIGTPLLDRSQRELQLTEAGAVLFRYARQLLSIKEEALFATQQEQRIIEGHLEIAASSLPGAYILPGLMKAFREKYTGVSFALMQRNTRQVCESVIDYIFDLGLVGETVLPDELEQILLLHDELVLISAPEVLLFEGGLIRIERDTSGNEENVAKHSRENQGFVSPLSEIDLKFGTNLAEFLEIPFVIRESGSATRVVFENALQKLCGSKELPLNVVACLESQEAIKEAVKIGLGVAVISRKAVNRELESGIVKGYKLPDLQLERSFYLIYRKNRIFSPLSQTFIDFCSNLCIS